MNQLPEFDDSVLEDIQVVVSLFRAYLSKTPLRCLGSGMFKACFALDSYFVLKASFSSYDLKEELEALENADKEGIPTALPVAVDQEGGYFVQRRLLPLYHATPRAYRVWNTYVYGRRTTVADLSESNLGYCSIRDEILAHDPMFTYLAPKYAPVFHPVSGRLVSNRSSSALNCSYEGLFVEEDK